MSVSVEVALPCHAKLGEGAVWDVADARLWWVDISAGMIHKFDPATGKDVTHDFGEALGAVARREAGGLVVSAKSGLYLFDPETGERTSLGDPENHLTTNRFNDGTTDLQGRFWAGTMHDKAPPRDCNGQFYRLDKDHSINARFDKLHVTNGLGFSPDGKTMYLSDSEPSVRMIWKCAYETETGEPGPLQPFFDTRAVAGRPDGATIDADGCYWMAGVGGSQIVRLTPEGKIDRIIDMPVEKPTKPMFGGPQLDTLFVTSIGEGYEKNKEQPEAGHLFAITGLGVTGLPQTRFAG